MGVSRQAVSHWVERYRKQGNLIPRKRGRLRRPVLTNGQKLQVRAEVATWLEEHGIALGDYIPRGKRPHLETIAEIIADVVGRDYITNAFARKTAVELDIPHYLEPLKGFSEDFDYPDEKVVFELDWVPKPKRPKPRPEEPPPLVIDTDAPPPRKRRRGRPPKNKPAPDPNDPFALDDDDGMPPQDIDAYKQWVKETKAMMARRRAEEGASPVDAEVSPPGKAARRGAGIRTGKHAKGRVPTTKRKKGRKKR